MVFGEKTMKERSTRTPFLRFNYDVKKNRNQWTVRIGFAIFLLVVAVGSGCSPEGGATCGGGNSEEEIIEGFQFPGTRFQNPAADGLVASDIFWFSGSDNESQRTIVYGWDRSLLQLRRPTTSTCDYNAPGVGCRQCDYCGNIVGACTDGTSAGLTGDVGPVASLFGSTDPNESEQPIFTFTRPYDGCMVRSPPRSFEVNEDSTFSLRKAFFCGSHDTLATFQARVIVDPTPKTEPTKIYNDMMDPALRYKFSMPLNDDGKLRENFSVNLRVKKVRVLLGVIDKATGLLMNRPMSDPMSVERARPSRIMFLTDFVEGDVNNLDSENENRCYLDVSQEDKGFDMFSCLKDIGGMKVRRDVTPTYMIGLPLQTLTWIVEYKMEAGLAKIPTFMETENTAEVPVLEFTIE